MFRCPLNRVSYLAQDGLCRNATVRAKLSGYVNVTSRDENALRVAIAQNGPVAVGIDASHRSFAFYSFGVYYEPQCGKFHSPCHN